MLEYLDRSRCSPCISDVARHLQISRQAAQRIVIRLRARGFVATFCYQDVRMVQCRITAPGADALRMASSGVMNLLWSMTVRLDDRTLESTSLVLREIQNRIRHPRYEE